MYGVVPVSIRGRAYLSLWFLFVILIVLFLSTFISAYAYDIESDMGWKNETSRFSGNNTEPIIDQNRYGNLKQKLFNITLITGDKVYASVSGYKDGRLSELSEFKLLRIEPVGGSKSKSNYGFMIINSSGSTYVIPENADLRKLDLELFNINYLIEELNEDENYCNEGICIYNNTGKPVPIIIEYSNEILINEDSRFDVHSAKDTIARASTLVNSIEKRVFPEMESNEILKYNLTINKAYMGLPAISAKLKSGIAVNQLVNNSEVKKIWLDRKYKTFLDDSVPLIHVPEVWDLGYDGKGIDIAILDTGIDDTHPDLDDLDDVPSTDDPKVVVKVDFTDDNITDDLNGHGTHCAGIAAGTGFISKMAGNGNSYTGVAPAARLWNVKVLDKVGMGSESDILAGIEYATFGPDGVPDTGDEADIISMSLGGPSQRLEMDDPLTKAVNTAVENGIVVVVAAGNGGGKGYSTVSSPGSASKVITVGSSSKDGLVSASSGRGPTNDFVIKPDVLAPGEIITAPKSSFSGDPPVEGNSNDNYTVKSGTSMSTPHLAGVSALLLQAHPDWTPEQIKNVLISTSDALGSEYDVYMQGGGLVNASRAIDPKIYINPASFTLKDLGNLNSRNNESYVLRELSIKNISNETKELNLTLEVFDISNGTSINYLSLNQSKFILEPNEIKYIELRAEPNLNNIPVSIYSGKINISVSNLLNETDSNSTPPDGAECEYYHSIFGFAKWNAVTLTKINMTGQPSIGEPVLFFSDYNSNSNQGYGLFSQIYKILYTNESGMTTVYLPNGTYTVVSTGKTENRCVIEEAVYRNGVESGDKNTLDSYRYLRDMYLKEEYVKSYYEYSPDIKRVLLENPLLLFEAGKLAVRYRSFLNFDSISEESDAGEHVFTSGDVKELNDFAGKLKEAITRSGSKTPSSRAKDIIRLISEFENEITSFEGRGLEEAFANSIYSYNPYDGSIKISGIGHGSVGDLNLINGGSSTQTLDASVYTIKEGFEVYEDAQLTLDERDTFIVDFDYNKSGQKMLEKLSVLYYAGDSDIGLWFYNLYSYPEGTETYISASDSFKAIFRYSYFSEEFYDETNPNKVSSPEFHMLLYNITGVSNHTTFSPDYRELVKLDIGYRTPIRSENAIWAYDCRHPDLSFKIGNYYEMDAPLSRVDWISPAPITCSIFYGGSDWSYNTPKIKFPQGTIEEFTIGEHPLKPGFDFIFKSIPPEPYEPPMYKLKMLISGTIIQDYFENNPYYLNATGNISLMKGGEVLIDSETIENNFETYSEADFININETDDFKIIIQGGNSQGLSKYVRSELSFSYNFSRALSSDSDYDFHPPKMSFRFPDSNIYNMVKTGKVVLDVNVEDEKGIGGVDLEYSLDGGTSWKKAVLNKKYDSSEIWKPQPQDMEDSKVISIYSTNLTCYNSKYISLKASSTDISGNCNNYILINAIAVLSQNVTILSPENAYYNSTEVPLIVEIDLEQAGLLNGSNITDYLSMSFNLNNKGNVTIPLDTGIVFTNASESLTSNELSLANATVTAGPDGKIVVSTIVDAEEGGNHLAVYMFGNGADDFFEMVEVDFFVDTIPPVLENLTIYPRNPTVGDVVEVYFQTEPEPAVGGDLNENENINVNVTYPNGKIVSIPFYKNIKGEGSETEEGLIEYKASFTASLFGEYLIEVEVVDRAGNTNSTTFGLTANLNTSNSLFVPAGSTVTVIENEQITIKVSAIVGGDGMAFVNANISDQFDFLLNENTSGKEYGLKYLNLSAQLVNISTVTIFWHYTEEEIIELNKNSLAIFFFDGTNWVDCGDYIGKQIPNGPFVYDTGIKSEENYLYLLVDHASEYAIGGNYSIPGKISDFNYSAGVEWVNMTWNDPVDPDIVNIELYVNGTFLGNVPPGTEFFNLTGLEPETVYEISITAEDSTGLEGEWSNYTVETLPDASQINGNETPNDGDSGSGGGNGSETGNGTGDGNDNENGNDIESGKTRGGGGSGGAGNFITIPFALKPDFYSMFTKTAYPGKIVLVQMGPEIQDRTGVFEVGAVFNQKIVFRLAVSGTSLTEGFYSEMRSFISEMQTYSSISDRLIVLSAFETVFTASGGFKELEPSGFVSIKIKKTDFDKAGGSDLSDLIILKNHEGVWSIVPYTLVDEDSQFYYLKLEVSSFSLFVVALGFVGGPEMADTIHTTIGGEKIGKSVLDKASNNESEILEYIDLTETNQTEENKEDIPNNWQPTPTGSIIIFFTVLITAVLILYGFRKGH